jgi:hypothetical protein
MDKHSSLLRKSLNYGRKKFYNLGSSPIPNGVDVSTVYATINHSSHPRRDTDTPPAPPQFADEPPTHPPTTGNDNPAKKVFPEQHVSRRLFHPNTLMQ